MERIADVIPEAKPSELGSLAGAVQRSIESSGGSTPQRLTVSLQSDEAVGLARIGFGAGKFPVLDVGIIDV
jgi:hypothetical protein